MLGAGCCARRFVVVDGVDGAVVTVDATVMSAGVLEDAVELMSAVGESVVGVARRELRRSDTVLREDCRVPAGEVVEVAMLLLVVLDSPSLVADLARGEGRGEERVLPREESVEPVDLAEDHMSLSVRGDFVCLDREEGGSEGGLASMSIASSGGGGERRWGEAEILSALRVREESARRDWSGG